jgi:hypothetical protein
MQHLVMRKTLVMMKIICLPFENLTSELSTCHDIISNLRIENEKLIAKVEKLVVCDDSIVSLRNDHASLITKIDKLNASLSSLKIENEKLIAKAKDLNVCNISISNLKMRMLFYMLRLMN